MYEKKELEKARRAIRKALRAWADGEMPMYPNSGICHNVLRIANDYIPNAFLYHLYFNHCQDVLDWEHYSGDPSYPIGGGHTYYATVYKWKRRQGKLRRELCEIMLRGRNLKKIAPWLYNQNYGGKH